VLLDDFSASGLSYLRHENEAWEGKVGTLLTSLLNPSDPMAGLVDPADLGILVVLYMATD
jgi:hypothetical protein